MGTIPMSLKTRYVVLVWKMQRRNCNVIQLVCAFSFYRFKCFSNTHTNICISTIRYKIFNVFFVVSTNYGELWKRFVLFNLHGLTGLLWPCFCRRRRGHATNINTQTCYPRRVDNITRIHLEAVFVALIPLENRRCHVHFISQETDKTRYKSIIVFKCFFWIFIYLKV